VYGLVDLSNLIQSIVLSDRLVILSGRNDVNDVRDQLKEKGLLSTLRVTRNAERTFNSLKGNWQKSELLTLNQNIDPIAGTIEATLSVNRSDVKNYIKGADKFANSYFDTPDWRFGGKRIRGNYDKVDRELHYEVPYVDPNLSVHSESLVRRVYVGGLLYFMTASEYGLNYSPDSVRIPLTASFSKIIDHSILTTAQSLMNRFDMKVNKQIEKVHAAYSMHCAIVEDIGPDIYGKESGIISPHGLGTL
jgi:hypothetical protein